MRFFVTAVGQDTNQIWFQSHNLVGIFRGRKTGSPGRRNLKAFQEQVVYDKGISEMKANRVSGFTLVEVLIVVVIMAVLAAVVIPQFSSSTDDAKRSTADFNLSTLRSIVQAYKGQHNGLNPVFDAGNKTLSVLLNKTKTDGTIDNTNGPYGPYLVEFPDNPFTNVKDVKTITNDPAKDTDVTPGNAGGWLYNPTSGKIWLDSNPGYAF